MKALALLSLLCYLLHLTAAALTPAQIEKIVNAHNLLRAEVLPTAADMMEVSWDERLAAIAQAHTDKCQWTANKKQANALTVGVYPAGVGENQGFTINNLERPPSQFVHEWFNAGSSFYNYSTNTCAPKETCRFYEQVVASNVSAIGCGFTLCNTFNFFAVDLPNAQLMNCIYGPIGAEPDARPYSEGLPCSACPAHSDTCAGNLCVTSPPTTEGAVTKTDPSSPAKDSSKSKPHKKMAPPLLTMPPFGFDIVFDMELPTTEPTAAPTLLPSHCNAPSTPEQRENCWREAWLLWTRKYNQWASGKCAGNTGTQVTRSELGAGQQPLL